MTMIRCQKHGLQLGPSCCDHVSMAAHFGEGVISYGRVDFDVMGDGTELFEYFICNTCLEAYNLTHEQVVPESIWAGDKYFPHVSPVCGRCFEALETRYRNVST